MPPTSGQLAALKVLGAASNVPKAFLENEGPSHSPQFDLRKRDPNVTEPPFS
jgi:hypothetical protein